MENNTKTKIKASFLIPLYNEAGIISDTLKNLLSIVKGDYEILLGLDGCTDTTADIVKEFEGVRVLDFKERRGKSAVVNDLARHAASDILFVYDADWHLRCSKLVLDSIIGMFEKDFRLGGIIIEIDNFNIQYSGDNFKCSYAFRGEIIASRLLREYQHDNCTYKEAGQYFSDKNKAYFPFMLNIFKKQHLKTMHTTGDDIERWLLLLEDGARILVLRHNTGIYLEVHDISKSFKTLFIRHIRSHISNSNIYRHYNYNISFTKFYLPATFYAFKKIYKIGDIQNIISVSLWYLYSFSAFIIARCLRVANISTKTLWKFRENRS